MSKEKKLYIGFYNDYYGDLLTMQQSDVVDKYYNLDLSLQEIADVYDITRQAVRDTLKRAEKALIDYEEKLNFFEKQTKVKKELNKLKENLVGENKEIVNKIIELIEE